MSERMKVIAEDIGNETLQRKTSYARRTNHATSAYHCLTCDNNWRTSEKKFWNICQDALMKIRIFRKTTD